MNELFKKVLDNYLIEKEKPLKDNDLAKVITKDLASSIREIVQSDKYVIKGSVGQGQWAEIPWICIFDKRVSTQTTKGIYIAILFKADMTGLYLTLNQGWTFFTETYKPFEEAKRRILSASHLLGERLNNRGYPVGSILLAGKNNLSKGYELGTIFSTYYDKYSLIAEDRIETDLMSFVEILNEVQVNIGENRDFSDFYKELLSNDYGFYGENFEEELKFQNTVEEFLRGYEYQLTVEEESPSKRNDPIIDGRGQKRWPRNSAIAATALQRAKYCCEVDYLHATFISNKTGKPYMEAHHLIPMSKQEDFEYSLDKIANIKCICPNCHRLIHHGRKKERNEVLNVLFSKSKDKMKKVGLEISIENLFALYE